MCRVRSRAGFTIVFLFILISGVLANGASNALPWNGEQGVRQCLNTFTASGSWYDKDNYDYCDVDEGFFFGKDVGLGYGRQLDVIDVVQQLRQYYANNAVTQQEARFSKDLRSCLRNYKASSGRHSHDTDRCRVRTADLTAAYWGLNERHRGSVEIWRALSAALGISAESAAVRDNTHKRYAKGPRRHGEVHDRHTRRHGGYTQSVQPVFSRTCQYQFGPKAGLREYFPPTVPIIPALVGWPCWDGFASHGIAVPD